MNRSGFTLIEILVVISIMALLLAFAVPSLSIFNAKTRLNISASNLASDLRCLQIKALSKHTTLNYKNIAFSPSGNPSVGGSGTVVLSNKFQQQKKVVVSSSGRIRID